MRTALAIALVLGGLIASASAADTPRPNFVIIIADDVSPDDLSPYDGKAKTPNLQQLASAGMRFDRAFLTCSSCSPSRCSIVTSLYPHQTGAAELHQPLPADRVTFAQCLHEQGYYTAAAGKWHLGNAAQQGFDKIAGGKPSGCEQWVQTLAERPRDKPFCLWLAALDAHRDYDPKSLPNVNDPSSVSVPPFLPDTPEVRRDLANYYDELTRLDDYLGQVLAELERQKVADNTVVIFLADNGRAFPRCKTTLYDSGIRTPLIVRWPGKVKAGTVNEQLVSSLDLAPTVLEAAGVTPPKAFVGRSMVKLLSDAPADYQHRDAIFAERHWHDYAASQRAIRTRNFLYIRNDLPKHPRTPPADAVRSPTYVTMRALQADGKLAPEQATCFVSPAPSEELYDVQNDPHCLHNLAANSDQEGTLKQLRDRLTTWARETNDTLPSVFTPDKFDRSSGKPLEK